MTAVLAAVLVLLGAAFALALVQARALDLPREAPRVDPPTHVRILR